MNNFNLERLVRENIKQLKPYASARDEFSGKGNYTFLDANENGLGSIGSTIGYNRYPDPDQSKLKTIIARQQNVSTNQIFIGNGSDEAIDLLFRAFCEPNEDKILIMPPTYGMYSVSANINAVGIVKVPLTTDFQIDVSNVLKTIKENTSIKMLFICSPNNPTGNLIESSSIVEILKVFKGLVIVDEAYIDFEADKSILNQLNNFKNLVVLQTFSKAYGLANLRIGKAFADENIISILNKIKPPYNVNGYSQSVAIEALQNLKEKRETIQKIIQEREKVRFVLNTNPLVEKVYPSNANFLLAKMKGDATEIYKELIRRGIVVRNRSNVLLCDDCLRFSIGKPDENDNLLLTLKAMVK